MLGSRKKIPLTLPFPARGEGKYREIKKFPPPLRGEGEGGGDLRDYFTASGSEGGKGMNRDRLKELAADERFIDGIYNYCDRWCERCPQTSRCLNFSIAEEDFSDPETRDIRNEAFWKKLSETLQEGLELLKEAGKKWGIDLENLDSVRDTESEGVKDEAAENHVICRAAKNYSDIVRDWFKKIEEFPFGIVTVAGQGVDLEEAFEVIRWYQYFIAAKVMRAIRGKKEEEEEEGCDDFPTDADGSAKIALIAIDRSIGAWAVIPRYSRLHAESLSEIISLLDLLGQAVEETFPRARSFIRPGFESTDANPAGSGPGS
jgi:hypothetical protein